MKIRNLTPNILCAVSLTALGFAPALAADVTALPEGNWTGAWLGAGAGGSYLLSDFAIDSDKYATSPSVVFKEERNREASLAAQMFTGTVEAGVDYQVGSQLVLGLVSSYDFSSGSGQLYSDKSTANNPDTAKEVYDAEVELGNSWAVGGRAGLLLGPRTMFYGTGGFTQADVSVQASYKDKTGTDNAEKDWSTENDKWTSGVFFGGGVETMLTDHVSAKLEYRFSKYDSVSASAETAQKANGTKSYYESTASTGDLDVQSVRATVAYHFGDGIAAADAGATDASGDWTGAWIGGGAGSSYLLSDLAIDSDKYDSPAKFKEERIREANVGADAFMGTLEAGADYQVGSQLVVGLVGNYDFGSGSGQMYSDKSTANNPDTAKEVYDAEVELGNSWGIGARAGLLLGPNTLFFGTGGFTQADVSVQASYKDKTGTDNATKDWSTQNDDWTSGMFVGGGVETMLTDHVSAKLEYRFARYDSVSADAKTELDGTKFVESTVSTGDLDVQSLRATVAWHF
jgi:outer membrane immunogenic protein